MSISAYPLQWPAGWPRATNRKPAHFGKMTTSAGRSYQSREPLTINGAVQRVRSELRALKVSDADSVVSTNLMLRLDGLPRSDQRKPDDPGAAVYWQTSAGPRVMAIDIYDRVEDNLAAIAKTLEALRAIERHGGARILERAFTGFAALPPPPEGWRTTLGLPPGPVTKDQVIAAFRKRLLAAHPDTGGTGTSEDIDRLTSARDTGLKIASQQAKGIGA